MENVILFIQLPLQFMLINSRKKSFATISNQQAQVTRTFLRKETLCVAKWNANALEIE